MLSRFLRVSFILLFCPVQCYAHMPTFAEEASVHGFNINDKIFYDVLISNYSDYNFPADLNPQGYYWVLGGCNSGFDVDCPGSLAVYAHDIKRSNSLTCGSVVVFKGYMTHSYWHEFYQKYVIAYYLLYEEQMKVPSGVLGYELIITANDVTTYNMVFDNREWLRVFPVGEDSYLEWQSVGWSVPGNVFIRRKLGSSLVIDSYINYQREDWEDYRPWTSSFTALDYITAISVGDFYVSIPYSCGMFSGWYNMKINPYFLAPYCGGADIWKFFLVYKDNNGNIVKLGWPYTDNVQWFLYYSIPNLPDQLLWSGAGTSASFSKNFIADFLSQLPDGAVLKLLGHKEGTYSRYNFINYSPPCGGVSASGLGSNRSELGAIKKGLGSVGKGLGGYEKIYR